MNSSGCPIEVKVRILFGLDLKPKRFEGWPTSFKSMRYVYCDSLILVSNNTIIVRHGSSIQTYNQGLPRTLPKEKQLNKCKNRSNCSSKSCHILECKQIAQFSLSALEIRMPPKHHPNFRHLGHLRSVTVTPKVECSSLAF